MKILVNREAMLGALNFVSAAIKDRSPKAALTCVKVEAKDKRLSVLGTNMDLSLQCDFSSVDISEPGATLIPAAVLMNILRLIPDDTATIESTGTKIRVIAESSSHVILSYPVDDFPPVRTVGDGKRLTIVADVLKTAFDCVAFSASRDLTRYATCGVHLNKAGGRLDVVGTDGARLAMAKLDSDKDSPDFHMNLPLAAVASVQMMVDDAEQNFEISLEGGRCMFVVKSEFETKTLISPLVEGTFAPYMDVIPKTGTGRANVNRERLLAAARQAALMTNLETRAIGFATSDNNVTLWGAAAQFGCAEIKTPADVFNDKVSTALVNTHLIEALKACHTETVTVEYSTPRKPVVVKAGASLVYVFMPVNAPIEPAKFVDDREPTKNPITGAA